MAGGSAARRPGDAASAGTAGWVVALMALMVSVARAWGSPQAPPLEPYHAGARSGRVSQVVGRIYEERRTPGGPDQPVSGVQVTLVPFSESLLIELDKAKEHGRASMAAYRRAAPRIQEILEAYLKALRDAGGTDLMRVSVADATGEFRFGEVPAGRWMLVARHSPPVVRVSKSRQGPVDPRGTFVSGPSITGSAIVHVWLALQDLSDERVVSVELTDRNLWYTGVVEETAPR